MNWSVYGMGISYLRRLFPYKNRKETQRMDLGNNVTLIGVLKKKEKHANNPDIKRPVLELETVYFEKIGEVCLCTADVLLSDMLLSKNVVGFSTGEILLVTGTIHNDANGLYVNANTMQRLLPATKKTRTQAIARSELLRLPAPINMTILTGVYIAEEEQGYLNRKRSAYLRGDLKIEDSILTETIQGQMESGKEYICMGQIAKNKNKDTVFLVSDYREVKNNG